MIPQRRFSSISPGSTPSNQTFVPVAISDAKDMGNSSCQFRLSSSRITAGKTLDLRTWRVGECPSRQEIRHVKTRRADPVVCHPIINVKAVR